MESARPARADDRPAIARLATEARAEARERRGGPLLVDRELAVDPFVGLDAEADAFLVAGLIDDVVVGYALVHVEPLRTGAHHGVIDELFVHPDARAVGVGEAMMDLIVARCRDAGCTGLDARALPGDRETKNFFETFGLVARALVVHRPLDPTHAADGAGAAGASDPNRAPDRQG